jgi:hypothetical protein
MSDDPEFTPSELAMVMPFVTTQSHGGPHDDGSYVAGSEMAQLEAEMRVAAAVNAVPCPRYLRTDNVPQVDLIAMRHGFTVEFKPWSEHPDEWTAAQFTNSRGITAAVTDG